MWTWGFNRTSRTCLHTGSKASFKKGYRSRYNRTIAQFFGTVKALYEPFAPIISLLQPLFLLDRKEASRKALVWIKNSHLTRTLQYQFCFRPLRLCPGVVIMTCAQKSKSNLCRFLTITQTEPKSKFYFLGNTCYDAISKNREKYCSNNNDGGDCGCSCHCPDISKCIKPVNSVAPNLQRQILP